MTESTPRPVRAALVAAALLAGVTSGRRAHADVQSCFDAALEGQKLQREGKLVAAKTAFIACAQEECPSAVIQRCSSWLTTVNDALPTIIVGAHDEEGHDLVDVRVTVDGVPQPDAPLGRAIVLDPGDHTIRWERSGSAPVDATIIVREHERGRRVAATFATRREKHVSVAAYALAGTAAVAAGAFAFFGARGYSDRQSFGCDQSCGSSEASRVRREFLVADVALGVAVLSLAGAVWFFFNPTEKVPAARVGWK